MHEPNTIARSQPLHGETAYVYGLKARAQRHHCLGYGTFSLDLGRVESWRKRYSKAISPITYVPLFIKATALTVEQHPESNAILFKRLFGYRIVQFQHVDVNIPVTRTVDGQPITFIATIRNASAKRLSEIQDEMLQFERGTAETVLPIQRYKRLTRMPYWAVKLVHWWMTRSPRFYVNNVGTCGVTFISDGHHDNIFPIGPTSVVFGIGAANTEPIVREGRVVAGRVQRCTLAVDNYVVSGLTGANLAHDFQQLLEDGTFVTDEIEAVCGPQLDSRERRESIAAV